MQNSRLVKGWCRLIQTFLLVISEHPQMPTSSHVALYIYILTIFTISCFETIFQNASKQNTHSNCKGAVWKLMAASQQPRETISSMQHGVSFGFVIIFEKLERFAVKNVIDNSSNRILHLYICRSFVPTNLYNGLEVTSCAHVARAMENQVSQILHAPICMVHSQMILSACKTTVHDIINSLLCKQYNQMRQKV